MIRSAIQHWHGSSLLQPVLLSPLQEKVFSLGSMKEKVYHLAGDGFISRFGWAKNILDLDPAKDQHLVRTLIPVSSESFPTPAKRPLFSVLICKKFADPFGFHLPRWEKFLGLAFKSSSINFNITK